MAGSIDVKIPVRLDFAGGWSDVHYFAAREGGAVLNGAITPCVEGHARWDGSKLHLEYELTLPPGSHLGTSASIDVAWLVLTNGLMDRRQSPTELAESAYRLEKLLGVEGGKQDQYAAALGGFNVLRFGAEEQPADIERLAVPEQTIRLLERRGILCYAGSPPAAGSVHERVWERYRQGDEAVADALRAIRDSVAPARAAILDGDLDELARLMTVNREAVRRLHPKTITERMDELFTAGQEAGALGSKACGAGGGGCLLFICAENASSRVEQALRSRGGEVLPFQFVGAR